MIVSVLKIIGISILILLAIIILILGIVLFVPIVYRIEGEYDNQPAAIGDVTWIPLLLKVTFDYHEGKTDYVIKLLGGVIMTNRDIPLSWIGRRLAEKNNTAESEVEDSTIDGNGTEECADIGMGKVESDSAQSMMESKQEKEQLKPPARKRKKRRSLLDKIRRKIKEWKRRVQGLISKLKQLNEKKDKLLKVYHSKRFVVAKQDGIRYIKEFFRILKPKKAEGYVQFGLEDPAGTGQILGIIAMLIPFYDSFLQIQPDFERAILKGKICAKGNVYLFSVVKLLLQIILNKNLIKVIKKVQTIIEA